MYLPSNLLAKILKEKGFKHFSKLYVSGEIGKCKASGNLYKYILEDLNITPDKILHIGDNKISDIEKARENSIETFYYKNIFERYKISKMNHFAFEYFDKFAINKISTSSITALSAINWINRGNCSSISLFPYISEGIFKFVKDYTKIFGINNFNFDANQAFEYIKCFWQNLSFLDVYMLSQIKHPTDSAQQVYVSLTTTDEERVKILNKKVGKKIELLHN